MPAGRCEVSENPCRVEFIRPEILDQPPLVELIRPIPFGLINTTLQREVSPEPVTLSKCHSGQGPLFIHSSLIQLVLERQAIINIVIGILRLGHIQGVVHAVDFTLHLFGIFRGGKEL